jgi:hypothetical protein
MNDINEKNTQFISRYFLRNKYHCIKKIFYIEEDIEHLNEKKKLLTQAILKLDEKIETLEFRKEKEKLELLEKLDEDEKDLSLYKLKKKIKNKLRSL